VSLFSQPHSARPPRGEIRPDARWLALGDSYTIGEGVAPAERWPARVVARLRAGGIRVAEPRYVATTGWTTTDLLAALAAEGLLPARESFDVVSLLIGVNDQYQGRDPSATAREYARCLAGAVALAGGHGARVVCVSIPDWGVTPFAADRDRAAIARAIDALNTDEQRQARAAAAHWCDVTALSRRHGDRAGHLAADGLHPGAPAYDAWAHAILPAAREALTRQART